MTDEVPGKRKRTFTAAALAVNAEALEKERKKLQRLAQKFQKQDRSDTPHAALQDAADTALITKAKASKKAKNSKSDFHANLLPAPVESVGMNLDDMQNFVAWENATHVFQLAFFLGREKFEGSTFCTGCGEVFNSTDHTVLKGHLDVCKPGMLSLVSIHSCCVAATASEAPVMIINLIDPYMWSPSCLLISA